MNWLKTMAINSFLRPRQAAEQILLMNWPREAVWTALALLAVLNGMYYSQMLTDQMIEGLAMPGFVHAPILMAIFLGVTFVGTAAFLAFSGRVLGGKAGFDAMLVLTVWWLGLRLVLQIAVTLIAFVAYPLANILALVGMVWVLFILISFLAAAHQFANPLMAVAALAVGMMGLTIGLSVLLVLLGVTPPEVI